jgi:hypothetical protein
MQRTIKIRRNGIASVNITTKWEFLVDIKLEFV